MENSKEIEQEIVEGILDKVVHDIAESNHEEKAENLEEPIETEKSSSSAALEKPGLSKESSTDSGNSENIDNVYHVKWISWNSQKVPIVTQNANGPCPMLAIANVLFLRGKMKLQDGCEIVSSEQLLEYLGDTMLECVPSNLTSDRRLDYEANVSDAVVLLPKLQTGIDVNVKFSGVSEFEYTSECIIFDLFNIALYHGWLVDPQQEEVVKAVDGLSYNQLVEKIISNKSSSDDGLIGSSIVAQNFLEESASQLTYHGLCELVTAMKEEELAIFFRNNHFSTVYKRKNELFLLVTDQGFLKENSVVWETLGSIDGDADFVDCDFVTAPPKPSQKPFEKSQSPPILLSSEQQLEQDMQIAKALEEKELDKDENWIAFEQSQLGDTTKYTDEELAQKLQALEESAMEMTRDEELARQLQEEENMRGEEPPQRCQPRPGPSSGSPGRPQGQSAPKTKNCTIL